MERFDLLIDELNEATQKLAYVWRDQTNSFASLEDAKFGREVLEPISKTTKSLINKADEMKRILRQMEGKGLI